MVLFISDSRVVFLIWFVVIAIVIASALILIEMKMRWNRRKWAEKRRIRTPAQKVASFLKGGKSLKEKLDFVGESAKSYFKIEYGILSGSDYSELAKEFEKRKRVLEISFCEKMFKAYYSGKKLNEKDVISLGDLFSEIVRRKERSKEISKVPGFLDKIENGIRDVTMFVFRKISGYIDVRREKLERKSRMIARSESEVRSWVRRAIRRGYDRVRIKGLLNDGKRSRKEVRDVLKVYGKESSRISGGEGVAERILKKEQARLGETESVGVEV